MDTGLFDIRLEMTSIRLIDRELDPDSVSIEFTSGNQFVYN